jgi:HTH-type transcriptional regulator/antitoxin HigA
MFDEISVIKSEDQYRRYLAELETLITSKPSIDSPSGRRLELLALLIENYEKANYEFPKPSPLEAIVFRLDQMGLKQSDLVPLIGSKGRVSEILSGKRKLTLPMIRKLSEHLDIPISVLVRDEGVVKRVANPVPLAREIVKRGWVDYGKVTAKNAEDFISKLWARLGVKEVGPVYFKRSLHMGLAGPVDVVALQLWIARVLIRGRDDPCRQKYRKEVLNEQILSDLARLSWFDDGPLLAKEYLSKLGIPLVVESHLPGTGLDGASMLDTDGVPVIGMTLRFDRLDNFWFTLLHECVHLIRHLKEPGDTYVDDTEATFELDSKEVEANKIARDALIPPAAWRSSVAPKLRTPESVRALANELKISASIVAGRIRRDSGNYKLLSALVGHGCVGKVLNAN